MFSHVGTNSNKNEVPHGRVKSNKGTPLWLLTAIAVFIVTWGGNELASLMMMYHENADLAPVLVDLLLLICTLGIASALLTSDPISNRISRKSVALVTPVSSILGSALVALGETTTPFILTGRFIPGLAVDIVMAVDGSWVKELSDPCFDLEAKSTSGAKRQSMASTLGLDLNAGTTGALAQSAPLPEQLAYIIHILISIPTIFSLLAVPKTHQSPYLGGNNVLRETVWESLRTPSATNRRFLLIAAMRTPWVFGTAGVAYAITPLLLQDHVLQPVFYFAMATLFALLCDFRTQQISPRFVTEHNAHGLLIAIGIMIIDMGLTAWVSTNPIAVTAFITALVLGAGYGLSMFTGFNEIQCIAGPHDMAGLIGIFYYLTYIDFAFPVILAKLSESISWMTYPIMLGDGMVIAILTGLVIFFSFIVDPPQRAE